MAMRVVTIRLVHNGRLMPARASGTTAGGAIGALGSMSNRRWTVLPMHAGSQNHRESVCVGSRAKPTMVMGTLPRPPIAARLGRMTTQ